MPSDFRLAVLVFGAQEEDTEYEQFKTYMHCNHQITNAVVVRGNVTHQIDLANGSICHIASLEVYRGKRGVTKISHNGFSLSDKGTIEVIEMFVLQYNAIFLLF